MDDHTEPWFNQLRAIAQRTQPVCTVWGFFCGLGFFELDDIVSLRSTNSRHLNILGRVRRSQGMLYVCVGRFNQQVSCEACGVVL